MASLRRALTTWLLLLALGLPLAQPATGSWHCPDGKLCVASPDGRFHCEGGQCRMACCAEASGGCDSVCDHGALPGFSTVGLLNAGHLRIGSSCRFTPAAGIAAAALPRALTGLTPTDSLACILADGPAPAEAPRAVGYVSTSGSSPPRAAAFPPTGPRAPPSV